MKSEIQIKKEVLHWSSYFLTLFPNEEINTFFFYMLIRKFFLLPFFIWLLAPSPPGIYRSPVERVQRSWPASWSLLYLNMALGLVGERQVHYSPIGLLCFRPFSIVFFPHLHSSTTTFRIFNDVESSTTLTRTWFSIGCAPARWEPPPSTTATTTTIWRLQREVAVRGECEMRWKSSERITNNFVSASERARRRENLLRNQLGYTLHRLFTGEEDRSTLIRSHAALCRHPSNSTQTCHLQVLDDIQ